MRQVGRVYSCVLPPSSRPCRSPFLHLEQNPNSCLAYRSCLMSPLFLSSLLQCLSLPSHSGLQAGPQTCHVLSCPQDLNQALPSAWNPLPASLNHLSVFTVTFLSGHSFLTEFCPPFLLLPSIPPSLRQFSCPCLVSVSRTGLRLCERDLWVPTGSGHVRCSAGARE